MKLTRTIALMLGVSALVLGPFGASLPGIGADAAFAKNNGGGGNGGGKGGGNAGGAGKSADRAVGNGNAKAAKAATASGKVRSANLDGTTAPKNGHGALASELKGLNAVHANANALANASPNSQVGRIALYRDAALETITAGEALADAETALSDAEAALSQKQAELDALNESHAGRSLAEIDAEIAGLDPAAVDFQSHLDALDAERVAAADFESRQDGLEGAVAEATADLEAAGTAISDAETALADTEAAESDALLSAANGRVLSDTAVDYVRDQLGL